ncbi:sugar transferase [Poseidonibacter lekithochrous]|uniref:sugar transferase n=1 Tax=Poseidonibacter TaxID=2321187 RepID=UPI001C09597D|nr:MULTISPECIES: sugar transferase [Poseidonibacter]MBU3014256.1 sugar transferase [Poseidonibacter lekithochrous]MDO6827553.1 sugar transferase [Poseidonibacter sp. 1_MG-2023]
MKTNKLNLSNILYILLLISMDFIVVLLSLEIAIMIREQLFNNFVPVFNTDGIKSYYWIMFIIITLLVFEKIYFIRYDFWSDTKKILKALIMSFIAVFTVITLTKMSDDYSRMFILIFFTLLCILLPLSKRLFKRFIFSADYFKIRVKVVANSDQENSISDEIRENWYFGFKDVKTNFDMVIISSKNFEVEEFHQIIKKYTKKTKDIYIIPYVDHIDLSHATVVDYFNIRLSAIHIENRLLNTQNIFVKYIFEKLLVFMIFPFALVLHIFISLLIKLDSKGTVFFKQKRFGKDGECFRVYKYRTMYSDSSEILNKYLDENPLEIEYYDKYHKYQNDPRITKIGKFLRDTSLDEFPQFYNILRGDMNLIGPRPYMLDEKSKIGKFNEEVILKVKPGISGLWQVSGRNELTFKERVDLDIWYIQNWSLWMDFVIFMKTIKVVLSKVGAK